MSEQQPPSILDTGQALARERGVELGATATATTDGQTTTAEGALEARGPSWVARLWARWTGRRGAKPQASAGLEVRKRFGA